MPQANRNDFSRGEIRFTNVWTHRSFARGARSTNFFKADVANVRWLALWWPAIVWAVVISILSTADFSSEHTGRVIIPVLHFLFPHASATALAEMHGLIRKSAHVSEYFILSWLILFGLRAHRNEIHFRWAAVAVILVALYASLDEFHQSFVPGRTPAVHDVLLDISGGVAAQIIAALVLLWNRKRTTRRANVRAQA